MAKIDEHANSDDMVDAMFNPNHYLPNGVKKYQHRTNEEKVAMCGRFMYTRRDPITRVPYDVREWPCKRTECKSCFSRRKWKRSEEFQDRITMSGSGTLFHKIVTTAEDWQRTRKLCNYYHYEFLAIPTGEGDEKAVFVNGDVKGTSPIDKITASEMVRHYGGIVTDKKVSGSLGKREKKDKEKEDASLGKIRTEQRIIQYKGVMRPDNQEYADATILASIRTGITELTEANLQAYLNKNDEDLVEVLKEMGFHPYLGKAVEVFVDLEAMQKHLLALTVSVIFHGEKTAVPPETEKWMNMFREDVAKYAVDTSVAWVTGTKSVC